MLSSTTAWIRSNWMLTGDSSPQSVLGIQNRWFERVHARATNPLTTASAVGKENKSVGTSDRTGAFVCLERDMFDAEDPNGIAILLIDDPNPRI